ncbi:MAG TPA: peptidase M61, partial [Thauera sp.]|nr:peptidase M61 [Thauera sp.]
APKAIVSYYAKGALIALALDVQLRAGSEGRTSLDDVMRLLWHRHGITGVGVPEDGIFAAVREVGGNRLGGRLARWLARAVEGCDDLPLARLLKGMGVALEASPASAAPALGWKLGGSNGEAKVLNVHDGGPAQAAGVSAGDVLVALDGLKVGGAKALDEMLARRKAGDELTLHVFRRDELMSFQLRLAEPPADKFTAKRLDRASAEAVKLRKGWLGG